MWKSGMMFRPTSASLKASDVRMLRADAHRLATESGTIFGREVVPEVCSTIAMSVGVAKPPLAAGPACADDARGSSRKLPAGAPSSTTRSTRRTPSFSATATAGEALPRSTISSLAFRSVR